MGGENIKGYLDWYKLLSEYGVYTNFFPVETSGKNKSILRLSISSNFSSRVIDIIAARVIQWSRDVNGQPQLSRAELATALDIPEWEVEDLMIPAVTQPDETI
ncbi:MAG: hypothetical protein TR69_WS6001000731 [candidate division WS6 bacterium OLB20]|uniref:Uncharacterized protein n=1 Tax=candidate division WS6 bacterium OLB20 TaxID=1617426 RepID=A0A136LYP6_9BACT|nr:MAG: hypothetical protein TR69_WS6001000731 [candidate division WS6 bacterium OLB20]